MPRLLDTARRRVILDLARQVPVAADPPDMGPIIDTVGDGLPDPALPKLLLGATPGAVLDQPRRQWIQAHSRNLSTVELGAARHLTPEDRPRAIAEAVATWIDNPP